MNKKLEQLMELTQKNEALKSRLTELSGLEEKELRTALVALAKEQNIELTEEDFEVSEELSDDALDTVSGGTSIGAPAGLGDFLKDWFIKQVDKFNVPKMPTVDPTGDATKIPSVDKDGIRKGDFENPGGTYYC